MTDTNPPPTDTTAETAVAPPQDVVPKEGKGDVVSEDKVEDKVPEGGEKKEDEAASPPPAEENGENEVEKKDEDVPGDAPAQEKKVEESEAKEETAVEKESEAKKETVVEAESEAKEETVVEKESETKEETVVEKESETKEEPPIKDEEDTPKDEDNAAPKDEDAPVEETKTDDKVDDAKEGKDDDVEMKDESKEETEPVVPVETPKKRGPGRPPKRKTPQSAKTPSTVKTPSSTRSSKRKTPRSAKVTSPLLSSSGSKRQRKSATAYEPSNFKAERIAAQALKQCPRGRGVPLGSIEKIKTNMNKRKTDEAIISALYRFIFGTMDLTGRGKPATNKIKSCLLEFSGYLRPLEGETMDVDGEDEETTEDKEARNAELKVKFQEKADDLSVATLKSFCDMFQINRGAMKKPALIEKLLEFLAEPSESLTKGSTAETVETAIAASTTTRKRRGRPPKNASKSASPKKRGRPGRPKKKKVEEEEEELEYMSEEEIEEEVEEEIEEEVEEDKHDDDDEDEVIDGKTIPSAKKLRTWVKAYVTCFDLDKCNAKHAISTATDKFKVDLDCKKNTIMQMLKEAIE